MNPKMPIDGPCESATGEQLQRSGIGGRNVGQNAGPNVGQMGQCSQVSVLEVSWSILETVTYYDCFDFPLTFEELSTLVGVPTPRDQLLLSTQRLVEAGWLAKTLVGRQVFYSLRWAPLQEPCETSSSSERAEELAHHRVEGERDAVRIWPTVAKRCRLIARFPFVRGVAVSGSLSKGVHFPGDDVDFFLVTASGRVWTCRLLLMLFKRVALFGSRSLFCINYLVDETALQVPDRNRFTAAEIAWLAPMVGHRRLAEFFRANSWVEDFLPSWEQGFSERPSRPLRGRPRLGSLGERSGWWLGKGVEWLLAGRLGESIERASRRFIKRRSKRRYAAGLSEEQFAQAMRAEPKVSKHHPGNQQGRILDRFDLRWSEVKKEWKKELEREGVGLGSQRS